MLAIYMCKVNAKVNHINGILSLLRERIIVATNVLGPL